MIPQNAGIAGLPAQPARTEIIVSDDVTQRILSSLERLESKQDTIRFDMDQMRLDMNQMRLDTGQLRTDVDKIEASVDKMQTGIDKMRVDIMERIDRLQHTVDGTLDSIIVDSGNTDRVERIARTALDDNRATSEILRVMQRQIMRLQTDVEQLKGPP
jgi:predicted  nucleic acid-binding Zn-ribbon protein